MNNKSQPFSYAEFVKECLVTEARDVCSDKTDAFRYFCFE